MKVSMVRAKEASQVLSKKAKRRLEKQFEAFNKKAVNAYLNKIPEDIQALFYESDRVSPYMNRYTYIDLTSEIAGMSSVSFERRKVFPQRTHGDKYKYVPVHKDQTSYGGCPRLILNASMTEEIISLAGKALKIEETRQKLESVILELGTWKNVLEKFPELQKYYDSEVKPKPKQLPALKEIENLKQEIDKLPGK